MCAKFRGSNESALVGSRRRFLKQAGMIAATAPWLQPSLRLRAASANEKLNIGVIGVAGRGADNLAGVSSENIVALCDVDERNLAAAAQKHPQAKTYHDFRRLIDQKGIDAIVISTPDHTHAVAAVAALEAGCHLYCEKPLARTISETRIITDLARKQKRVTQLGTQIHAGNNYRRVVELVQAGVLGSIREVHVWAGASYGGVELPKETPPVPPYLHYDLWVGPVEFRPFSPEWVPFKWRNWWAFGGGALADFGCHFMDLPHWALGLRHPSSAEVVDGPPVHPHSAPPWLIVRYQYPARDERPPVQLNWYHGGKKPALLPENLAMNWPGGVLFVGEKGMLLADYGRNLLLPQERFADFVRPQPTIPDSVGHHREWIEACKNGGKPTCHFDYSGPLTEAALLGNVAYRAGKKIEWDSARVLAKNCPEADEFIRHRYRSGWSL